MRNLKKLGIVALATLALGGLTSTSASAHMLEVFQKGKVTGTQEGEMHLPAGSWGSVACFTTLNGEIPATTKTAKLTLGGYCSAFGIQYPFSSNGCSIELTPGMDGFGVGPSGCGPITVKIVNCTISIPAQNGLYATYSSSGGGVKVSLETQRWRYSGCGAADSETNTLKATWNLSGTSVNWIPEENVFDAEYFPATISGTQTAGGQHLIGTEVAAPFKCADATFSGTLSEASHSLPVLPTFSECQAFGFLSAGVTMNSCKFINLTEENYGENFPFEIDCLFGQEITISAATCSISIPEQTVKGVDWANATPTSPTTRSTIKNTLHISGLAYTVTKDGIGCPFKGTGPRTDGTYTGETLYSGTNPGGRPLNLDIGL